MLSIIVLFYYSYNKKNAYGVGKVVKFVVFIYGVILFSILTQNSYILDN